MALPNETDINDALLRSMHELGRPASIDELESAVIRLLNISDEDASEIHERGRTKFSYRLAWARTNLKNLGLLQSVERGVWMLTERGTQFETLEKWLNSGGDDFESLSESNEPEGLDKAAPEEVGEYPIDSVLIRQETRTVFEIVRRIRDERFIMDPDFQRDFIWPLEKQSKLIESMVMRIPLPVFYLAERDDGKTVVVDGLQRLTTFLRFLNNDFPLKGLELAPELNGLRYINLAPKLQNRLEDTQLILYLIDSKVPERAKLDIFDRVNGGVSLTRQQMRNSIYCGPATRWLREEVKTNEFAMATGNSLDWRTMRDRECVNRFCAFSIQGVQSYSRGDMDAFLAQTLKIMNRLELDQLENLRLRFRRSMRNNYSIFGAHSFRKHRNAIDRRSVINVALFDVFSVLLSRVSEDEVTRAAEEIHKVFFHLMDCPEFIDSISFSTNSTSKVKTRFALAELHLKGTLNVHINPD